MNYDSFESEIERKSKRIGYAVYDCLDCDKNTLTIQEYYMLDLDLWNRIHPAKEGMLCIMCVEKRLGRQLTAADFTSARINDVELQKARGCSELLLNRLTR